MSAVRRMTTKVPKTSASSHLAVVRELSPSGLDDGELAVAAATGRPGAAREVFRRFGSLVRGLLVQTLGPFADVDDLVQETFLRFFRRARDLRDPSALRSFLVGIAMRVARSELRRRRVRRFFQFADPADIPEPPVAGEDLEGREALRRLYGILDRLDVDTRFAFILRQVRGLELEAVASALGCSVATAKRRLSKADTRVLYHARRDTALLMYVANREPSDG